MAERIVGVGTPDEEDDAWHYQVSWVTEEDPYVSKIGFHIYGPSTDSMYAGEFSIDFLNDPDALGVGEWVVDWDNIDDATETCTDECDEYPSHPPTATLVHVDTNWPYTCQMHKYMGYLPDA